MERLYDQGIIVTRDIESMYEALFLRAVTSFEIFLQDLLVAILKEKVRYRRGRVSIRMKVASNDALMEILLQGGKYLTWLPFNNTEDRAKLYLRDGKPFTEFTDGDKSMINTITTIRHAIAHKSPHAKNQFQTTVIGSRLLLPRERSPAGFLRSPVRHTPTQNQFEVYTAELGRLASVLC